ncbi:DUF1573 domain-containing protein [Candidatus Thiodictyon syntrophicum]|uniref:DUF1573 domain-containing protein n=1 Tax=Candidatus Thiodictyon syntrophicum TaxID=1166950 RepID=UPI0012FDF934|nr:DUF1573 domain-containing protein [Candidatus Thiodictyon syntrophicum]
MAARRWRVLCRFLIASLLVGSVDCATAQGLSVEPNPVDMGPVAAGSRLQARLSVRNESDRVLTILDLEKGCHVMVDLPDSAKLAPGAAMVLTVTWDADMSLGVKQTRLFLRTDSLSDPEVPVNIVHDVRDSAALFPASAVLRGGACQRGEPVFVELRLIGEAETDLKEINVSGVGLRAWSEPLDSPGRRGYRIGVALEKLRSFDVSMEVVTLEIVTAAHRHSLDLPVLVLCESREPRRPAILPERERVPAANRALTDGAVSAGRGITP